MITTAQVFHYQIAELFSAVTGGWQELVLGSSRLDNDATKRQLNSAGEMCEVCQMIEKLAVKAIKN